MSADREYLLTRRRMFLLAGAGVASRLPLGAATVDFWNKKPPADWTNEEIDRLITKSPWAKQVKAQYAAGEDPSRDDGGYPGGTNTGGGYPGGGTGTGGGYPGGGYPGGTGRSRGGIGIPGIGGIGIPGLGGKGRGRGGVIGLPYRGRRCDGKRPSILDAMKSSAAGSVRGPVCDQCQRNPAVARPIHRAAGEEETTHRAAARAGRSRPSEGPQQRGGEGPGSGLCEPGDASGGYGLELSLRVFQGVTAARDARYGFHVHHHFGPPRGQGAFSAEGDAVPWRVSGVIPRE